MSELSSLLETFPFQPRLLFLETMKGYQWHHFFNDAPTSYQLRFILAEWRCMQRISSWLGTSLDYVFEIFEKEKATAKKKRLR